MGKKTDGSKTVTENCCLGCARNLKNRYAPREQLNRKQIMELNREFSDRRLKNTF